VARISQRHLELCDGSPNAFLQVTTVRMSSSCFQAVVIGAGPAGLATGLALSHAGIGTAIIGPRAKEDGRTAALFQGSIQFLENLGAWQPIRSQAEPIRAIRLADATGHVLRAPEITFNAPEIGLDAFGYNVPTSALTNALDGLADRRLTRIVTAGVKSITCRRDVVVAETAEGESIQADLAAAADGRASLCRQAAGIETRAWTYPQAAIVCAFRHTRPHEGISTELHRTSGPLTVVPMPGHTSSLVWVETPGEAERLAALDDAALLGELSGHLGGLLGRLDGVTQRTRFPLSGHTATVLAKGRIALVGEAGHVIPPIGAQGLNLSLRDAATLAELCGEAAGQGRDIGADGLLEAFETRRRADVASRVWSIDLMNRSLLSEYFPVHALRGLGLIALKTLKPLRQFVMREGVTTQFSTPRLMRAGAAQAGLDGRAASPHHGA